MPEEIKVEVSPVDTDTAPGGQDEAGTPEESAELKELRKTRREAQELRRRLNAAEKAEQDRQTAEQQAQGKHEEVAKAALDRAAKAEAEVRARDTRDAATEAARTLRFAAPESAYRLIRADVEYDADGTPTNLDSLLKALATDFPGLLTAAETKPAPKSGAPINGARDSGAAPTKHDLTKPPSWGDVFTRP